MIDVCFIVLPGSLLLDLAGPAEAFRLANQARARRGRAELFQLRFIGPEADAASSVGLSFGGIQPLPSHFHRPTWVVLLGERSEADGLNSRAWFTTRAWLAETVAPRLGGSLPTVADGAGQVGLVTVCAGALFAADAGLVGTRRCTTHHESLDALRQLAPHAGVVANRVFVVDGPLASSAGITAGIDLALHLIATHADEATAAAVARAMVVFLRRGPDDPELSPLLTGRNHLHPALHRVQDAVCERPSQAWNAEAMAAVAHVTPRHLGRLFNDVLGVSPRVYVEQVRMALAREAMRRGAAVESASDEAGFTSARQWRRARARHSALP
jgi:transcriptional regulator GlxA family with amidase domain